VSFCLGAKAFVHASGLIIRLEDTRPRSCGSSWVALRLGAWQSLGALRSACGPGKTFLAAFLGPWSSFTRRQNNWVLVEKASLGPLHAGLRPHWLVLPFSLLQVGISPRRWCHGFNQASDKDGTSAMDFCRASG
jgi:hypothetical protein